MRATPRRFWTAAAIAPAGDGHTVTLDGREIRTPARALLVVPTAAYAEGVRAEWDAQDGAIRPDTMPLTRTANSAIDTVGAERARIVDMLADFADSDLLCYRAEGPPALAAEQAAAWDPLIDWAEAALGVRFAVTSGVMPVAQPVSARQAVAARLHAAPDFELAALHDLIHLSGSAILGLAVHAGRLAPEDAWRLSRMDEDWQIAEWGEDAEAAEVAAIRKSAFLHAARVLTLLGDEPSAG